MREYYTVKINILKTERISKVSYFLSLLSFLSFLLVLFFSLVSLVSLVVSLKKKKANDSKNNAYLALDSGIMSLQ
jgi:cbb3-type cytochrome oxidase subunit 3